MGKNKAIILAIIVLVVVAIAFCYLNQKQKPEGEEMPTTFPKATGNINDAVNAFLQAANDENLVIGKGEDDKTLILSDSKEIGDFNQSANENEF